MTSFICLIGPHICTRLSDEPTYMYFFSILFPHESIHHEDPLEEAMTSAHRLEANSNYAYGGYFAGAEASPHLRNQSCTQFPSCLWYALSLPHDLELRRFGCWGADLAGALSRRCHLGASPVELFMRIWIRFWFFVGWAGDAVEFLRGGSLCTGRALVLGPVSLLVSLKLP
jgi:hypothetical protein